MSTAVKTLLTAEEFWLLPDNGKRRSLIRGEVVETMPPGGLHGIIATLFSTPLRIWCKEHQAGVIGTESGFLLDRDPDIVVGPDVYFVRAERLPPGGVPEAFWDIPPDLAVEIVSPGDTAREVREKVRDYLDAGTTLVWVAYPSTREVVAHTPDGLARTFRAGETLTSPAVLPGFACPVAELFP